VAARSAADELRALEQARSRLEAALAEDENWRALVRPVAGDDRGEAAAARRARNVRLQKALAENEYYRAWKHINDAINELRAKGGGASSRSEAGRNAPEEAAQPDASVAGPRAAAPSRLMRRLESLGLPSPEEIFAAPRPAAQGPTGGGKRAPSREDKGPGAAPEPAEATVTFVVREVRESQAAAMEPPGAARPDGTLESPAAPFAAPESDAAEAEVVILTDDAERARREAEEQARLVRRFRKALSDE
jgi:hypothetical protein